MSWPIAWVSTAIRTPCSAARSFTPSSDGTWVDSTQPDEPPTRLSSPRSTSTSSPPACSCCGTRTSRRRRPSVPRCWPARSTLACCHAVGAGLGHAGPAGDVRRLVARGEYRRGAARRGDRRRLDGGPVGHARVPARSASSVPARGGGRSPQCQRAVTGHGAVRRPRPDGCRGSRNGLCGTQETNRHAARRRGLAVWPLPRRHGLRVLRHHGYRLDQARPPVAGRVSGGRLPVFVRRFQRASCCTMSPTGRSRRTRR